jgi:multidrug efflux pump
MNPRAPQSKVHFGEVPIAKVFDMRGFNLNAKLEIDPEFLSDDGHDHRDHDHDHDHEHDHDEHCDHPHHHHHDDDVKSFVFRSDKPFAAVKLEDFLGSIVQVSQSYGPDRVFRYNGYLTADINGGPAPGYSTGQAKAAMERILAETLPNGVAYEWTDLTYQEILVGNSSVFVFPLCVLLVVLVLAALYESWTLPLAIVAIVPMALLFAIGGVWLSGGDNNIFTQVAFFVLMGLACKNAILIVEFARELQLKGQAHDPVRAALEACRMRLRPILMTSIAFIMGVVPLVLSSGAGAEMRHAMGVAVFAGMIGVTLFGLFLTPVFYVMLQGRKKQVPAVEGAPA